MSALTTAFAERSTTTGGEQPWRSATTFFAPILSGGLLGLSFRRAEFTALVWIGLVPLCTVISTRGRVWEAYIGGYLGGIVFNLITADWIRIADGGSGLSGASAVAWLLQAQIVGAFWPLTILLGRVFAQGMPSLPMSIGLPLVWVCHEFLVRAATLPLDGSGWPFYALGYGTASYPTIAQLADISGVSTPSFLVASVNGGIWDIWTTARHWCSYSQPTLVLARATSLPIILGLASYAYGTWRLEGGQNEVGPTIMLMPPGSLNTNLKRDACLATVMANRVRPDLMFWGELAYNPLILGSAHRDVDAIAPGDSLGSKVPEFDEAAARASMDRLEHVAARTRSSILVGLTRASQGPTGLLRHISAAFVDPVLGLRGFYDKMHLVVQHEFTPKNGLFEKISVEYEPGTECRIFQLRSPTSGKEVSFSPSICYDIAFPELYSGLMRRVPHSPEFFAVCSSERWDSSGQLARHLFAIARFRAIECRRAVVRNVSCGYSGIIDSNGQMAHAAVDWQITEPTVVGHVPIDNRKTLFVRYGDWISGACVMILGGADLLCGARGVKRAAFRTNKRLRRSSIDAADALPAAASNS